MREKRPGDICNEYGDIKLDDRAAAQWGVCSLSPGQAAWAERYGWQKIGGSDGRVHVYRDSADRPAEPVWPDPADTASALSKLRGEIVLALRIEKALDALGNALRKISGAFSR